MLKLPVTGKKLRDDFPDAFVIAVKGNKTVPLQEALEQKKNRIIH